MKIAILGTRGIPNYYGGFEQFAEYLSVGLVKRGHEVTVYNSHSHPYQESTYEGVKIKHIYDPENKIGTAGQFIYDMLCILDTRKNDFDIILQLGYTSSSIFFDLHPRKSIVVTNMDGLEWKRTKYSSKVQKFLQWAESLAVKKSDFMISDSIGIQNYIKDKYGKDTIYIPYGSYVVENYNENTCTEYGVEQYNYDMLIARLEPENSIEVILDGVAQSQLKRKFLVIGKHETKYGEYLKEKFKNYTNIIFVGGIYNQAKLDDLRNFSNLYFHGHTVGGTNPSLLEAMGSQALICANNNEFNSAILGVDALYFNTSDEVAKILDSVNKNDYKNFIDNNIEKIKNIYEWETIIDDYEKFLNECLKNQ
jgi:glycosyltransferase involved in cell wall biosynthesis